MNLADDLLAFIHRAPTPYHAVEQTLQHLDRAGFRRLDERDRWSLGAGDRFAVVRNDGSLIAAIVGREEPAVSGFRILRSLSSPMAALSYTRGWIATLPWPAASRCCAMGVRRRS